MYSHIKRLRARGERKPDRDISADPGFVGNLTVFRQGTEIVAAFYVGGGTGQPGELLPTLYRARLVTMHGQGMLFQGWERPLGHGQQDTDPNKQEWSVRLMADPPAVPAPTERLGSLAPLLSFLCSATPTTVATNSARKEPIFAGTNDLPSCGRAAEARQL